MKSSSFREEIDQRVQNAKNNEQAPSDSFRLENGNSNIEVRKRGAFITECQLMSFSDEPKAIDLLYCDPDLSTSKLTASHMMAPVGPSEDIGGQHGLARWADWHVFEPTTNEYTKNPQVTMQAKRGDYGESLLRTLELGRQYLTITSELKNNSEEDTELSLGEHLYFPCNEKDIEKIELYVGLDSRYDRFLSLSEAFGQDNFNAILNGEPFFWPDFTGYVAIRFNEGSSIEINCGLNIGDEISARESLGMLIWHKPGTDSICFEPVAGFHVMPDGTLSNDGLQLASRNTISLETTIGTDN